MIATADRVLIVEDEESSRSLLAATLEKAGYEAASVDSADEALERLARGEKWDLVLVTSRSPHEGLLRRIDRDYPATAAVEVSRNGNAGLDTPRIRSRWSDKTGPRSEAQFLKDVLGCIGSALAKRRSSQASEDGPALAMRVAQLEEENRRLSKQVDFTRRNLKEQFRVLRQARAVFYDDLSKVMAIIDSLDDGIVCTGADGRVILLNPAAGRMLGVPPFVAMGKPLEGIRGNEVLLKTLGSLRAAVLDPAGAGGAISSADAADGGSYFRVHTSALPDFQGNQSGALTVIRDVSMRKKAEHLKNQFLSIVAHELRTPLTTIKAFATIMDRGLRGELPKPFRPMMHNIVSQADRLGHEIDKIISLGRLQAEDFAPDLRQLPVDRIVGKLLTPFVAEAEQSSVDLSLADQSNGAEVVADLHDIQRALRALIENALKFTPSEGRVELRVVAEQEAVCFEVRDDGIGISSEDHEVIFEEFTQLENPLTREHGGSGLGLCFAARILRAHGARIEVESALGKGAVFRFRLPRA